jgi:hypothetical protein
MLKKLLGAVCLLTLPLMRLSAATRTEAALSLLEAPTARPAALGEALTAATDDVSAFSYNPASLATLERGHATFLYHRGINDDAYGQFLVGQPHKKNAFGLSVGYYDGGKVEIAKGNTSSLVTAQSDLVLGLGMARHMGRFYAGVAGKYFSSELAETDKATAYAADAGVGYRLSSRIQVGAAVQNIGTQLKFNGVGNELPRIARVGMAMALPAATRTLVLLDAPYYLNQSQFYPAVGLEAGVGPLAFRVGYKVVPNDDQISLGAGFRMGPTELSYAFQLADRVNSQHRISVGMRFGDNVDHAGGNDQPSITTFPDQSNQPWWNLDQPK